MSEIHSVTIVFKDKSVILATDLTDEQEAALTPFFQRTPIVSSLATVDEVLALLEPMGTL